jgi:site-specific recombinase XerC
VKQAEAALKAYLKVRDAQPEYDEVFIASNGTSMDVRTVRYRIHKYYKEAGIKKKVRDHGVATRSRRRSWHWVSFSWSIFLWTWSPLSAIQRLVV